MSGSKSAESRGTFTIIETLITIFVLTTIIAGFFFAKKIIKENNVKSLVMQIKKYDAALNSFTEKYHALPGDIQGTITYGITKLNTDGNGDNVITDRNDEILMANGEITNFWMHLSKSKMLDENYDGKEGSEAKTDSTFPASKLGEKIGIIVFGDAGKIFYQIGFDFADANRLHTKNRSLKTDEAFLFDKKFDDGNPQKGRVIAAGGESLNITKNDQCVKFSEYDKSNPDVVCQLRIEAK